MLANCEHCGKEFEKTHSRQIFCEQKCRFYNKTVRNNLTNCLEFTGAIVGSGYRGFGIGNTLHYAHRVAWEMETGPIPPGKFVLHTCDVRCCVEISHLFLGSHLDNMRDMWDKNRGFRCTGTNSGMAVLTEDQVLEIKSRLAAGESRASLASSYGVSRVQIGRISTGARWGHVHLNPVKPDPEHPCSIGPFQWEEEKFPLL